MGKYEHEVEGVDVHGETVDQRDGKQSVDRAIEDRQIETQAPEEEVEANVLAFVANRNDAEARLFQKPPNPIPGEI